VEREEKEEEEREREDKFDKASVKLGKSKSQVRRKYWITHIERDFIDDLKFYYLIWPSAFNIFFKDVLYKLDNLKVNEQNLNFKID